MKNNFRKLILVVLILIPFATSAQDKKEDTRKTPASSRVQRRAAKQKWKDQRALERSQKKMISDHDKRLQTKKTRKRMRQEKKKSEKLLNHKKEFFLVRWFKYKHH